MRRPIPKTYLIPLAYRLQELAYGPMAEKSAKQFDNLADQIEKAKKFTITIWLLNLWPVPKLIREFQCDLQEVLVSENGFIYQRGKSINPLSAIARKITGTKVERTGLF